MPEQCDLIVPHANAAARDHEFEGEGKLVSVNAGEIGQWYWASGKALQYLVFYGHREPKDLADKAVPGNVMLILLSAMNGEKETAPPKRRGRG